MSIIKEHTLPFIKPQVLRLPRGQPVQQRCWNDCSAFRVFDCCIQAQDKAGRISGPMLAISIFGHSDPAKAIDSNIYLPFVKLCLMKSAFMVLCLSIMHYAPIRPITPVPVVHSFHRKAFCSHLSHHRRTLITASRPSSFPS